jgi:hypothetical protein
VRAAVIGGTVSALGGGKFANGAVTAAFQHLFNTEWSDFLNAREEAGISSVAPQAGAELADGLVVATATVEALNPLASFFADLGTVITGKDSFGQPASRTAAGVGVLSLGTSRRVSAPAKIADKVLDAAEGASSQILRTSTQQLQRKFKHAADFGIQGNYNAANGAAFRSAINQHINSSGVQVIQGTYRGVPVTHYVNPQTGLNVMSNSAGEFLSGWKLSPQQLQHVLTTGNLGGD